MSCSPVHEAQAKQCSFGGEQIPDGADWDLRHTFQNERRIMLLGTATTRLEFVQRIDRAWYEMVSRYELEPLELGDCAALWRSVTGNSPCPSRVRAVQILTGGNPRLLAILASFSAKRSFRELMDQLVDLIDDRTEYFRSHLLGLPLWNVRYSAPPWTIGTPPLPARSRG